MPDKEIKKGLRYCLSNGFTNCKGCPYHGRKDKRCAQALYDDVIALINGQQAIIDRLKFIQHTKLLECFMTETVHQQQLIQDFVKELKKYTFNMPMGKHTYKVITEQGIDTIAERMGVNK